MQEPFFLDVHLGTLPPSVQDKQYMNMTFHAFQIPSKDTYTKLRPWMRSVFVTQVSLESLRLQPLEVESLEALELERTESLWSELCGGGRALSQTAEHRVQRLHSLQGSYWKSLPQGS